VEPETAARVSVEHRGDGDPFGTPSGVKGSALDAVLIM
jgi:hypothetical protein